MKDASAGCGKVKVSWLDCLVQLGLAASVLVALGVAFTQPLGLYDEGFALTSALRLMHGDTPHRDYWAAYPAGTSIVLAGAFRLIEPTLLVSRIVHVLWCALLLGSMYGASRLVAGRTISCFVTGMAAYWVGIAFPPSYAMVPGLALCMASLWQLVVAIREPRAVRVLLAGVLAGSVMLFRLDLFGYLFVAGGLAGVIELALRRDRWGFQAASMTTLLWLTVMAVVGATCLVAMVWASGWLNFFDQTLYFPATGMRENRILPVPLLWAPRLTGNWLLAWGGLIAVAGLFGASAKRCWHDRPESLTFSVVVLALSLLLTLQSHNRLDLPHAAPSFLFALILWAVSFRSGMLVLPSRSIIAGISPWLILGLLTAVTLRYVGSDVDFMAIRNCFSRFDEATCLPTTKAQDDVVAFVGRNVSADRPVLVVNARHDSILVNDASLYFRLRRPVPVPWHEMHPGVVTTAPVQSEIIRLIESRPINHVVVVRMPDSREPNASAVSSKVGLLDRHLASGFEPVYSSGIYTVLQRIH